jgi:acetyl esterase/lipase
MCLQALILAIASQVLADQEPRRNDGNRPYPPKMENAVVEVYKSVGDVKLNMYIFRPKEEKPGVKRPAIVFFFGGGWRSGSPQQFEQQCEYLASRGMVAMAADYRVASRHGVKAVSCVADAKSAVRWVRANADRLGVDPDRIAAGGGSAGGHLAACTGMIDGFDEADENAAVSSRPTAMVLFNPSLVLAPVNGRSLSRNSDQLKERMGVEPETLSPYHHVKAGVPPTLILHGKNDTTVLYEGVQWFADAMKRAGNRCELIGYENEAHGFFNFGKADKKPFIATLTRTDEFLASLGYLGGEPFVERFVEEKTKK